MQDIRTPVKGSQSSHHKSTHLFGCGVNDLYIYAPIRQLSFTSKIEQRRSWIIGRSAFASDGQAGIRRRRLLASDDTAVSSEERQRAHERRGVLLVGYLGGAEHTHVEQAWTSEYGEGHTTGRLYRHSQSLGSILHSGVHSLQRYAELQGYWGIASRD